MSSRPCGKAKEKSLFSCCRKRELSQKNRSKKKEWEDPELMLGILGDGSGPVQLMSKCPGGSGGIWFFKFNSNFRLTDMLLEIRDSSPLPEISTGKSLGATSWAVLLPSFHAFMGCCCCSLPSWRKYLSLLTVCPASGCKRAAADMMTAGAAEKEACILFLRQSQALACP